MRRVKILFIIIIIFLNFNFSAPEYTKACITDYTPPEFSHSDGLRTATENDSYRLLVCDDTAIFGLQDKKNNYIWWSSPVGELNSDIKSVTAENLRSSVVVRYGQTDRRTDNNYVRSGSNACSVGVSDIENGIRIDYDYNAGFHFYVDYVLESDHMKATLNTSGIIERNPTDIITEISLLGSFGAQDDTQDGYFIIPDGSGAVINFNNNKTDSEVYRQKIYGENITAVPEKMQYSGEMYFPVYAIVNKDNALMAVISQGDADAYITAEVSGQNGSNYNTCGFTFVVRNTDSYYMSGESSRMTVFEGGAVDCGDIEVLYYPVYKKNINYIDIAGKYRDYLVKNYNISPHVNKDYSPLYLKFYGGVQKKKSFMGVPFMQKQKLTSYSEAEKILKSLDTEDIVISYDNWTDSTINNKTDTEYIPSGTLGGKKDFDKLKNYISKNNYEFYPSVCSCEYLSGNGFGIFSGTVRISGVYTRIPSYNMAFGTADNSRKKKYLLSPEYFHRIVNNIGTVGFSAGDMSTMLYGSYGKNKITRYRAMQYIKDSLDGKNILSGSTNAYILPYTDHIINLPMHSGGADIFDYDIPFCQAVLHGIIPYTSVAINSQADMTDTLLMSAVTGSNLYYDIIYSCTDILKNTQYDYLYYTDYSYWNDIIIKQYNKISPLLEAVSDSTITAYNAESSGTITTEFSSGDTIRADFLNKKIYFNNELVWGDDA